MSLQCPNYPTKNQFWENGGLFRNMIPFTPMLLSDFLYFIKDIFPYLCVCNLFHAGSQILIFVTYKPDNRCL